MCSRDIASVHTPSEVKFVCGELFHRALFVQVGWTIRNYVFPVVRSDKSFCGIWVGVADLTPGNWHTHDGGTVRGHVSGFTCGPKPCHPHCPTRRDLHKPLRLWSTHRLRGDCCGGGPRSGPRRKRHRSGGPALCACPHNPEVLLPQHRSSNGLGVYFTSHARRAGRGTFPARHCKLLLVGARVLRRRSVATPISDELMECVPATRCRGTAHDL